MKRTERPFRKKPLLDAPPADALQLRKTLGRFATGVTIVTSEHQHEPVGFTCQSFTSVSLSPPIVSFCASTTATTWARIREAGVYTVNVLAEDQKWLCERFTSRIPDRFAGHDWQRSPYGPFLRDALASIACELVDHQTVGDHDIALRAVRHIRMADEQPPLLFFQGAFPRLRASDA